jgi:hypothetical protein
VHLLPPRAWCITTQKSPRREHQLREGFEVPTLEGCLPDDPMQSPRGESTRDLLTTFRARMFVSQNTPTNHMGTQYPKGKPSARASECVLRSLAALVVQTELPLKQHIHEVGVQRTE